MMGKRTLAIALVAAASAASPAHAAKFDGNWSMLAQTTRGHCGNIPVGLTIRNGRIHSTSGSYAFHPIDLSGRISASGEARLMAVTGPRIARGSGHFSYLRGTGKWSGSGPSGLCFGVWTAERI